MIWYDKAVFHLRLALLFFKILVYYIFEICDCWITNQFCIFWWPKFFVKDFIYVFHVIMVVEIRAWNLIFFIHQSTLNFWTLIFYVIISLITIKLSKGLLLWYFWNSVSFKIQQTCDCLHRFLSGWNCVYFLSVPTCVNYYLVLLMTIMLNLYSWNYFMQLYTCLDLLFLSLLYFQFYWFRIRWLTTFVFDVPYKLIYLITWIISSFIYLVVTYRFIFKHIMFIIHRSLRQFLFNLNLIFLNFSIYILTFRDTFILAPCIRNL